MGKRKIQGGCSELSNAFPGWNLAGIVLSVSLLAASFTAFLLTGYYNRIQIRTLGSICQGIMEKQPEAEGAVLSALKEYQEQPDTMAEESGNENIVLEYGYRPADFLRPAQRYGTFSAAVGFLAGGLLFLIPYSIRRKKDKARIHALTDYLEQVNSGGCGVLFPASEDEFSQLQDEIYKTVTELHQTRDAAWEAKQNYADHLYDIAHQIKTPITSLSLSAQMIQKNLSQTHLEQIRRQLSRLTYLADALLLLSRIDAGVLPLEQTDTDVYTVLMLAADQIRELCRKADVTVRIPEMEEIVISADLEWTMEAVINLMKNCMEHTPPGGSVCCSCEQTLLYTQIRIWDNGMGFAEEDLPHLFERFYRGKNAKDSGIGIGLALAKAIIESQNGTITAENLAEGGACFDIRLYTK